MRLTEEKPQSDISVVPNFDNLEDESVLKTLASLGQTACRLCLMCCAGNDEKEEVVGSVSDWIKRYNAVCGKGLLKNALLFALKELSDSELCLVTLPAGMEYPVKPEPKKPGPKKAEAVAPAKPATMTKKAGK